MKCVIFGGEGIRAIDVFNRWAKGKFLTRDVIIHSHVLNAVKEEQFASGVVIIVFFDEEIHPSWVGNQ